MKKLDIRGFAHDVLLVGFLVVFAIGGVAYVVASRAATCDATVSGATSGVVSAVSGAVSDPNCAPVSGTVSGGVSAIPPAPAPVPAPAPTPTPTPSTPPQTVVYGGSCTISGVTSAPNFGTTVKPYVMVKNTGNQTTLIGIKATITSSSSKTRNSSKTINSQSYNGSTTGPGLSYKRNLPPYTVGHKSKSTDSITYTVKSTNSKAPFSCTTTFTLPK